MAKDDRAILEILQEELDFIEKGRYGRSVRTPWLPKSIFQDSLSCLNYGYPYRVSRIIPGDWGKVESGWLTRPLSSRIARFGSGGRIHQFLWQRSRAVSNARRNLAARND
jgi:hypothetical protein